MYENDYGYDDGDYGYGAYDQGGQGDDQKYHQEKPPAQYGPRTRNSMHVQRMNEFCREIIDEAKTNGKSWWDYCSCWDCVKNSFCPCCCAPLQLQAVQKKLQFLKKRQSQSYAQFEPLPQPCCNSDCALGWGVCLFLFGCDPFVALSNCIATNRITGVDPLASCCCTPCAISGVDHMLQEKIEYGNVATVIGKPQY